MKTKYSSLFFALLACCSVQQVYAGGSYVTTAVIPVDDDVEIRVSANDAIGQIDGNDKVPVETILTYDLTSEDSPFYDNYDHDSNGASSSPKAIVKDGQGTLIIDKDLTVYNPLVIREGTTTIENVTVKNYSRLSDGVSNLSVGGNNAHLILDGAKYYQYVDYNQSYNTPLAIGRTDGMGALILKNGSTLHSDHVMVLGYSFRQDGMATSSSISPTDTTQYSNGEQGRSVVNIEGGSTLSSGTALYLANVDVNIKGEGSQLTDFTRNLTGEDAEIYAVFGDDPHSDSSINTSSTVINITEGGALNLRRNLCNNNGSGSSTIINVTGKSEENVASSVNILGYTALGYFSATSSSKAELNLTGGAVGNFGKHIYLGRYAEAVLTVDAASTLQQTDLTSNWLYIFDKGIFDSAGTSYANAAMYEGSTCILRGGVLNYLYMGSGDLDVKGTTTIGNAVIKGGSITLAEDAVLSMNAGSLTIAEGADIALDVADAREALLFGEVYTLAEDTASEEVYTIDLFTDIGALTLGSTSYTGAITLEDGVSASDYFTGVEDTEERAYRLIYSGADDGGVLSLAVVMIPEPTTATLSLLALLGLAARRRR